MVIDNFTNKIYNCSCMDIMKQLPDESINLIATDPPYKMLSRGNSGSTGGMLAKKVCMKGDVFNHNSIDCEEYAPEFYRVFVERWFSLICND